MKNIKGIYLGYAENLEPQSRAFEEVGGGRWRNTIVTVHKSAKPCVHTGGFIHFGNSLTCTLRLEKVLEIVADYLALKSFILGSSIAFRRRTYPSVDSSAPFFST